MHPARKPLATLAITLGTFLIMLGAPALAGADDDIPVDLDASAIAQTLPSVELAAADDTDGATAAGTDTDGAAPDAADGTAVVGVGAAAAADSVAADGVAVSGDAVVGAGIAVATDSATADGGATTDGGATADGATADGTNVVGTDQAGQNGTNGTNSANGTGTGTDTDGAGDDGNTTGGDTGGEPSPAANDPVLADNAGISPATIPQDSDRDLPEAGGPASMLVLMSGFGLIIAGVVVLSHGRIRVARHRAV